MVEIILENTGKRFNKEWIFKNLTYTFTSGNSYAITGTNGSGKSTLLQIIAGSMLPSFGSIKIQYLQQTLPSEELYKKISIAAPYLDVVEEMTTIEFLHFHSNFKPFILPISEIIKIVGLEKATNKQIRYFSSGMKQRVKLAQAVFTNSPILLLDEPCTNLDVAGFELYHHLIQHFCSDKLLIVCSNDENEIKHCKHTLHILNWK
jgi:ABC-type multidrug transport system ATPase subunit